MRKTTLDCGCQNDGHRWLSLCAAHGAEAAELHNRAAREHATVPGRSVDAPDAVPGHSDSSEAWLDA